MKIQGELKIMCNENKAGKLYIALVCDLGYRIMYLSFKTAEIAELVGLRPMELYEKTKGMENGDYIRVEL